MRALILAAGRASRLGGRNKLLVEAGGQPVHAWHRRALEGFEIGAVIRPHDAEAIHSEIPWLSPIVEHDAQDGPVGALLAYLEQERSSDPLTVIYADTLLPKIPQEEISWVGLAKAPGRIWDYYDGEWTRGIPYLEVCLGAYGFSCITCLRTIARNLIAKANGEEVHMATLLAAYDGEHLIQRLHLEGWQDAGDPEAIARVKPIGD